MASFQRTAEVRHPEQQWCIIIICKSENLGVWSHVLHSAHNGFQKATWLFKWLFTVPCFTVLPCFSFLLTVLHKFTTPVCLKFCYLWGSKLLTQSSPASRPKVQLKHACAWCHATYAKEIKGKNPPGSVLKRFVIWIPCKSSLPWANYNSFSLEESLFWSSIWMLTFWAMSEPSTCKCPNQRQLKKVSLEGVIHYQVASNDPCENGKVWRKKSEKVVLKLCTLAALRGDAKT